jgi:NAD+ synthase (glutamine-hydrolysing)
MTHPFHSIYTHKFIRVAVCTPFVRVADPQFNLERTLGLARRASDLKAAIALFPELGISAHAEIPEIAERRKWPASCNAIIIEGSNQL